MIAIKKISPHHPAVQDLIEALDAYQEALYPPESNHLDPADELSKENVFFVGAFVDDVLAGCGAVKIMGDAYGEIKRVFVRPEFRGQGLARLMMDRLEQHLIERGIPLARLETGIRQPEALRLYQRRGYTACGPFGDYTEDPLSLFMEKRVVSPNLDKPEPKRLNRKARQEDGAKPPCGAKSTKFFLLRVLCEKLCVKFLSNIQ